jgi:plastocyanin
MKFLLSCLLVVLALRVQGAELGAQVTDSKGAPVVDAVVSLVPLDGPVPPIAPAAKAEVAQENQEFMPYVTVIQAGTRVVFPNRDTVQHHVYSLSKAKKFELPLYNPGEKEFMVFDIAGLVTIGCNIHDWMISHLVIVPTPWFAKSDAQGAARVEAPAGRYRLELWHPRLAKPLTKEVSLADGTATRESFTLTLKPDRRVRRAAPGKTGGY